jgi:hypothetical protein
VEFEEALKQLGFEPSAERPRRGVTTFAGPQNLYLTYWVHAYDDGTALFTWEFAVNDYLLTRGIQIGSSESLNLFMFPVEDERGPQDPAWLAGAMDRADARLRGLSFADPE